jgi:putative tryptophan/tyrosine transport system substrate-binding protein
MPSVTRIAILWDPTLPTSAQDSRRTVAAAEALGLKARAVAAHDRDEIDRAFQELKPWRPQALMVLSSSAAFVHVAHILELAKEERIPAIYGTRLAVFAGALMSYGPELLDQYRHTAAFVDKILKGAKPADLPVEQPTRFELVVNLKTAALLKLTIPESFLQQANEIIR